ncbi:UNVERIFIED_CONTAM: hypothetical protein GTU68_052058 [Idotea baltica]|nr:hypothetical protein [Idotea baltica]
MVLRYAPSPTGPQHIGGLRTALYCYLLAKQQGGELILRIEDTDQTRFVEGAEDFIIKALNWLELDFTQGVHVGGPHAPYRQSERSELYQTYAKQLVDNGHAYYAFDTPEELEQMREELIKAKVENRTYNLTLSEDEVQSRISSGAPYVIRFKVPKKDDVRFLDLVRGHMHFHSSAVDDKVLVKSDGLPTYHLANVVDDHHMEVTHVIRGEEWLSSAPLHVLLYRALGWEDSMPSFAHLSLLLSPDGRKLSKREAGATWEGYANLGYLPEAVMNYIALLGWNPGTEQEIMSREELIQGFSMERCHKAGARFDMKKLNAFQEHYLRNRSTEDLAALARPALEAADIAIPSEDYLQQTVALMRERMVFAHDLAHTAAYLFQAPTEYNAKAQKKWKAGPVELLIEFKARLENEDCWNATDLKGQFEGFVAEKETGFGKVMAPLRLALTGVAGGPGLFEIMELIGKTECIQRIESALVALPV